MTTSSPETLNEADSLLSQCNLTELLQTARRAGYPVSPTSPRAWLEHWLKHGLPPEDQLNQLQPEAPAPRHPIDEWRRTIYTFRDAYAEALSNTLTCPLQADSRACAHCTDMQVMFCITENKEHAPVLLAMKRRLTVLSNPPVEATTSSSFAPPGSAQPWSIAQSPRDAAVLLKGSPFQLAALFNNIRKRLREEPFNEEFTPTQKLAWGTMSKEEKIAQIYEDLRRIDREEGRTPAPALSEATTTVAAPDTAAVPTVVPSGEPEAAAADAPKKRRKTSAAAAPEAVPPPDPTPTAPSSVMSPASVTDRLTAEVQALAANQMTLSANIVDLCRTLPSYTAFIPRVNELLTRQEELVKAQEAQDSKLQRLIDEVAALRAEIQNVTATNQKLIEALGFGG